MWGSICVLQLLHKLFHIFIKLFNLSLSWSASNLFPPINSLLLDIWFEFYIPISNANWYNSSALLIDCINWSCWFKICVSTELICSSSILNLLSMRVLIFYRLLVSCWTSCVNEDVRAGCSLDLFFELFLSFGEYSKVVYDIMNNTVVILIVILIISLLNWLMQEI